MEAKVLSFQKNQALGIVQISTDNKDTFSYISGDEAIKEEKIEVMEINESGSVNNINILNHSKDFVFFMDGDILTGAKQNRVLNTSVLLFPESKSLIPVSCIESGRWRYSDSRFSGSDYSAPSNMRSAKAQQVKQNLNRKNAYESDQSDIWNSVRAYDASYCVNSITSNLSDIYDSNKNNFESYIELFNSEKEANGIAVFIRNKLLSLDIFNRADIYSGYFPKILKGSAMEAYSMKDSDKPLEEIEAKFKTLDFLDKYETMKTETYKGVCAGEERRFETNEITGFDLFYNENLIHLAALNLNGK